MRELKVKFWDKEKKQMIPVLNLSGVNDYFNESFLVLICQQPERYEKLLYTGSKDKNGQEIWEGDMVKCESLICKVEYVVEPAIAGFVFNADGRYIEYAVKDTRAIHYEVIGNIYENPELLKEKK